MLLPRTSIRTLLFITALCGLVFFIFALGQRGSHWALGVSWALLAVVAIFVTHVVLFSLVWSVDAFFQSLRHRRHSGRSPTGRVHVSSSQESE